MMDSVGRYSSTLGIPRERGQWLLDPVGTRMDLTCPICWEVYRQPVRTICGHAFCEDCLLQAVVSQLTRDKPDVSCPLCRQLLNVEDVIADETLMTRLACSATRCGCVNDSRCLPARQRRQTGYSCPAPGSPTSPRKQVSSAFALETNQSPGGKVVGAVLPLEDMDAILIGAAAWSSSVTTRTSHSVRNARPRTVGPLLSTPKRDKNSRRHVVERNHLTQSRRGSSSASACADVACYSESNGSRVRLSTTSATVHAMATGKACTDMSSLKATTMAIPSTRPKTMTLESIIANVECPSLTRSRPRTAAVPSAALTSAARQKWSCCKAERALNPNSLAIKQLFF